MAKKATPKKDVAKDMAKKATPKKETPKKEAVKKDTVKKLKEAAVALPKAEKVPKAPKAPKVEMTPSEKIEAKAEKAEKKKAKKEAAKAQEAALAAESQNKKWAELKEKHGKEKASTYSMTGTYQALTPVEHKVLGWGYILSNNNDRLEVLFESGTKILISNFQR